ncbi:MAG: hypothetical protein ACXVEF_37215 [Polyangiales bacterium]
MRRILLPLGLLVFAAAQIAGGGCSSSSELYGGGGCESFCTKWVGAHCRNGPTKDECMAECTSEQDRCRDASNALMRCATLEATIACETGSGEPRIVGCAPRQAAQQACLDCYTVCKSIADAQCSAGPSLDECQAACGGPTCNNLYQRFVDCHPGPFSCTPLGELTFFRSSCGDLYAQLQSCLFPGAPFFVPKPTPDAGLDVSLDGFGGIGP